MARLLLKQFYMKKNFLRMACPWNACSTLTRGGKALGLFPLTILSVFMAFSLSLRGADFYVSPDGDDANPGTVDKPWRTISRATKYGWPTQYRQPGDTVWLRGGLYLGNANGIDLNGIVGAVSGKSNAPITIRAYPGETPVVAHTTSPYRGAIMKNMAWWVFDGITFSNCYQSMWLENVTNFVLKNCTFGWMPTDDSSYAGVLFWGVSQYNVVSNCTFYAWGRVTETCNDHGVSISIGNETTDDPMWYNLVVSNRFFYGGHDHLQLNAAYNVIRGNLFVNAPWMPTNATCYQFAYGGGPNTYGAYGNRHTKPGDGGTNQVDMRNVFEYNQFLYTGPPPDDNGAFGIELGTRQSIYRYNVIAFSLAAGIFFNTSGTTTLSTSNAVYNNVIYGNGLSWLYGGDGMKSYSGGLSMSTFEGRRTNNYILNNIVWYNWPTNIDGNIYTYQQIRTNWCADYALPDPLFVSTNGLGWRYDPSNLPDFRLQPSSPCIDAGTWLAYCVGDGSGTILRVDNSLYFSDGNRIVEGDLIQLQGQMTRVRVLSNDWANATLYLSGSLTWTNGQGVALAYEGKAPDMGAYEMPIGAAGRANGAGSGAQLPIPPPGSLRVRPSP